MIKKFKEFMNEEIFFRGGHYVLDKYRVDKTVDGNDDNGKPYDIKEGDSITLTEFLPKTNAYKVEHEGKPYELPAEVVSYMELRQTQLN